MGSIMSACGRRISRPYLHPSPESGFLSRQQVSERYGFSISFLANLPRSALWYHKVGHKIFYEPKDVDAFIRGQGCIQTGGGTIATSKGRGRPRKPAVETGSIRAAV